MLTKLGKMIPASGSLTARCTFKAVDQDIMTILAMCEGGMAGRRLRWRGLAGVTDAVVPGFPAGRLELMAGRLRLAVSSRLPAASELCRRTS